MASAVRFAARARPVREYRLDGSRWRLPVAALVAVLVLAGCARDLSALAPSLRPGEIATPSTAAGPSTPVAATPKPSRAPKSYEIAIAAFVKSVASKKLSYRIVFEGKTRAVRRHAGDRRPDGRVGRRLRVVVDL